MRHWIFLIAAVVLFNVSMFRLIADDMAWSWLPVLGIIGATVLILGVAVERKRAAIERGDDDPLRGMWIGVAGLLLVLLSSGYRLTEGDASPLTIFVVVMSVVGLAIYAVKYARRARHAR